MKTYLISYATDSFKYCQDLLHNCPDKQKYEHIKYSPKDLDSDFILKNEHILKELRGAGYWVWKPYIIKKTLDQIGEEDIVVYSDCGDYFYNGIFNFIEHTLSQVPYILVKNVHKHKDWCKKYCFEKMNCTDTKYIDAYQLEGGFCVFKNTKENKKFLDLWQKACEDKNLIDDCNIFDEIPSFKEHRHDQAILTNLAISNDLKTVPIQELYNYIIFNYCKP